MSQENKYPVFVRVSKAISGTITFGEKKEIKQNMEISFSYLPAPDFQDELEYMVVETGEIRRYKPYDHVTGFIIFVSEKTYRELDVKRQFCVHYIMKDEKSKFSGWMADFGLSNDSRNELLRLSMEKQKSWK